MTEIAVVEAVEIQPAKPAQAVQANVLAPRSLARNRLDDLRKLYRKHIDWQIAVRDYLAGMREQPSGSKMPSKPAKAHMYDAANWFLRHYGIDLPRPSSLADVGAILVAAEIRLAGLDKNAPDVDGDA